MGATGFRFVLVRYVKIPKVRSKAGNVEIKRFGRARRLPAGCVLGAPVDVYEVRRASALSYPVAGFITARSVNIGRGLVVRCHRVVFARPLKERCGYWELTRVPGVPFDRRTVCVWANTVCRDGTAQLIFRVSFGVMRRSVSGLDGSLHA